MHICFLCNEYPPAPHGGIGSFVQTVAHPFVERGHRVTVAGVYPPKFGGEIHDGKVRVIRVPRSKAPGLKFPLALRGVQRALRQVHAEHPIDVIEAGEDAAVFGLRFPSPRIVRMHGCHAFFNDAQGLPIPWWPNRLEKQGFAWATDICAVGRYVAETTRRLLQLGPRPITVIPNPVDTLQFKPSPDELEEPGLLVFIGTMIEKKGVRQLLQAMPGIVAAVPEARLELYGGDTIDPSTGGSYQEAVQRLIDPKVASHIKFRGKVPRESLPGVLACAQVCVYPSHMEAHPIAWLEALAAGKALVASDIGPGSEVVADGVDGLLCDPRDPASIAASVVRALRDPGLRASLKRNARRRAESDFALDPLVERNLAYYRDCIASFRRSSTP